MNRYNRCKECYNMKCVFVTGEREDFDTSECKDFRPMTNADHIRNMTDEELARWLANTIYPECPCCPADCDGWDGECPDNPEKLLGWLKSPAEEGEG